jgi:hypothetical protein
MNAIYFFFVSEYSYLLSFFHFFIIFISVPFRSFIAMHAHKSLLIAQTIAVHQEPQQVLHTLSAPYLMWLSIGRSKSSKHARETPLDSGQQRV